MGGNADVKMRRAPSRLDPGLGRCGGLREPYPPNIAILAPRPIEAAVARQCPGATHGPVSLSRPDRTPNGRAGISGLI